MTTEPDRQVVTQAERQQRQVAGCAHCLRLLTGPPPTDAERREAAERLGVDIGE
jgi:ribosomal protein L34E